MNADGEQNPYKYHRFPAAIIQNKICEESLMYQPGRGKIHKGLFSRRLWKPTGGWYRL